MMAFGSVTLLLPNGQQILGLLLKRGVRSLEGTLNLLPFWIKSYGVGGRFMAGD